MKILKKIKLHFVNVLNELKLSHWSTKEELFSYTKLVLVITMLLGSIVFVFDYIFQLTINFVLR